MDDAMKRLAEQFERDMMRDAAAFTLRTGASPSRYLSMIRMLRGVETAKRLGGSPEIQDGLALAFIEGCPELTVEHLMVHGDGGRYHSLFTGEELATARRKLGSR